jgi:hypothetical protein
MGNLLLIFGAILLATVLIIINEHLINKSATTANKKPGLNSDDISIATFADLTKLLKQKDNSAHSEEYNGVKKELSRLKGALIFFVLLLSLLFYLSSL